MRGTGRLIVLVTVLATATAAHAQPRPGGGGPVAVGVAEVRAEDVPYVTTLPGRAVAFQQVLIRPQVGGEVTEIAYEPGRMVDAGDELFQLADEGFSADLIAAQAARQGAEATLTSARATVDRYRRLEGSGVSRVDLQNAEVALSQAEAGLTSADAALDAAQRALDHATIRSPIRGIADLPQVSVGDLVSAGQAAGLTTVTRIDPIYVDVAESSARILRNRARIDQGSLTPGASLGLRLILETGATYEAEGRMVSPGIGVSPTTGTVPIRIEFPNSDRLILPGQFLRVEVTLGQVRAMLVPQRATSRSANGALTAFVARDGKAHQVTLTETGVWRNAWMVTDGIEEGDDLILDGLSNLRAGAEVTTTPVQIDDQGVVRDVDTAGSAAQPAPEPAASGATAQTTVETPAETADPTPAGTGTGESPRPAPRPSNG